MASNNNKGKGKGGFGMTHNQRLEKAMIDQINRKNNNDGCVAKRMKQREKQKQSS